MTHEWVERKNKEYLDQFKNYPQDLIDAWNEIPEEYRKTLTGYNDCDRVIRLFAAQIKLDEKPLSVDVFELSYQTEESQIRFDVGIHLGKKEAEERGDEICKSFEKLHKMANMYFYYLIDYNHAPYDEAEDKVMEFDGDIIITDPCYLRRKDDDNFDDSNLEKYGIHGISSQTFYGDWSCHTFDAINKDENGEPKVLGEFCADGGMVCVADLNSVLKYNPDFDYHKKKEWTTTWIDNFKGTVCISIGQNEQERWPAYIVRVVGKGIDKKTSEPIEFATLQTGL